ncbi:MAG TPA: FMN-binding negative transcriptional regulator [Flavobacteriaceae bacterium]|nr:FMN-binding negative transcriptional regulator [Flavobacteriaceae bacterium]
MYLRDKYLKNDRTYIFDFIQMHPFAILVLNGNELLATHIPILAEGTAEKFRLYGHIAHSNEQFSHLQNNTQALLIFQGPQAYVSSSWYREKEISTWDYSAVHINVDLFVQSAKELEFSLRKLVSRFEKEQKCPLFYDDIPKEILEENLPLIKGFWCEPTKIQAIAKFHQEFEKEDIESVIAHLTEQKDQLAHEVSKNIQTEHGKNY